MARLEPGLSIALDYADSHGVWILTGYYETDERQFVTRFLRPADVFLDVGANIGYFTLLAARRVPQGAVHAFEPCASTYQRLVDNVMRNGLQNVRCHRVAVSEHQGTGAISFGRDGYHIYSSMARPLHGTTFATESVPCIALDDFVQEHGLSERITLIKIDVEGWEGKVLKGASHLLAKANAPTLLVEFAEPMARRVDSSCGELFGLLRGAGYQLCRYDSLRRRLSPVARAEPWPYINLVATKQPQEAADRVGARVFSP